MGGNEPSLSSIGFVSTNTKFIVESPSPAKKRRLNGFDELYQALEIKDDKIGQLTAEISQERQKYKTQVKQISVLETQNLQ